MPAVFVPTFFIFFMMYICKVLTLNLHISQKDAYLGLLRAKGSKIYRLKKQHNENDANSHVYYNLQETRRVSASQSIKYLNQCKDLCLQMYKLFPFEFKYHRLVYRQVEGDMKYIIGECLYTFRAGLSEIKSSDKVQNKKAQQKGKKQDSDEKNKKWYPWKNLQQFVSMSVVQDEESREQKKAWESYLKDCEDDSLKLSESNRIDFKLTLVHSNFQYFQNQGFQNLQPFDDIGPLIGGLAF